MYKMKCEDESQVQTHLELLLRMQEQLTGMGAGLAYANLISIILGSLLKSYCPLINAITMSATNAKVYLKPKKVMESLLNEFNHLAIEDCQLKASENALTAGGRHGKSKNKGGSSSTDKLRTMMSAGTVAKRGTSKGIAGP